MSDLNKFLKEGCKELLHLHVALPEDGILLCRLLASACKSMGGRNAYSKGKTKFKTLLYLIKTEAYLGHVFLQNHFQKTQVCCCCCPFVCFALLSLSVALEARAGTHLRNEMNSSPVFHICPHYAAVQALIKIILLNLLLCHGSPNTPISAVKAP